MRKNMYKMMRSVLLAFQGSKVEKQMKIVLFITAAAP